MTAARKSGSGGRPRLGVAVFFAVAFGLPWVGWFLTDVFGLPWMGWIWFGVAPSVAGFAATFAEGGPAGLKRFCARVLNPRHAYWPMLLALLLPLLAGFLTFSMHTHDLLCGGTPDTTKALGAFTLMSFFGGPLSEEFGWRGYLLELLCRRLPPEFAGLIIGPIWVAWHVPVFYATIFAHWSSALGYLLWAVSWSVVFALLVTRARGSVLPSILGHWMINNQVVLFAALLPALPHNLLPGGLLLAMTSALVAVGLSFRWRDSRWLVLR